ncbi:MAG: VWA domain-containing protein [Terracidiphilus sp.]|jgi:VWFA-related protein
MVRFRRFLRVVKVLCCLIIAGLVVPAHAAKRVTVQQLEETLRSLNRRQDGEVAERLSELELTERLNPVLLQELNAELPGDRSKQALRIIADESQFVAAPSSEIPARPAPDISEQRRIMGSVATYVETATPHLPNFFAVRTTDRFEDTPLLQKTAAGESSVPYQPLHFAGQSQADVLYRDGLEVAEPRGVRAGEQEAPAEGLVTWGVFGPILGSVLVDAATSNLAWGHWEQGAEGPIAVFDFHVPQEKSHYEVNYCCVATEAATAANVYPFRRIVAYHGAMSVDPSTGVIMRLVVEAELKATDPVTRAAILVDYGPIEIAGKSYICPLRSLSMTTAQTVQVDPVNKYPLANEMQPLKTALNDASFDHYQVFRADARVLTPEEAELVARTLPAMPVPGAASTPGQQGSAVQAAAGTQPSTEANSSGAAPPAASPASEAPPASSAQPAASEISVASGASLPDIPAASPQPAGETGFHLRTTSRLVEVTVVAFDKKGHPITDLKPDDLEVYDNGRRQTINSFSQGYAEAPTQGTAKPAVPSSEPAQGTYTNLPASAAGSPAAQRPTAGNTTIFLLDASHVAFGDLAHARSEMLRFLKTLAADEPVGLYILRKYGFQILKEPTADHDAVAATLSKWMPSAQDLAQAQNEEQGNRQQMDYVHSVTDLLYVNGNTPTGEEEAYATPDPKLRSLGDNPQRDVLEFLVWVARHLAAFPGHKSLVWVSSDNVLADFSDRAPASEKGDKQLDPLSLRAREALNDAHVSIYPLDASELEAGGVGADLRSANVQLAPGSEERVQGELETLPPGLREKATEQLAESQRDMNPGRLTAQMQQDMHPIQGTFRDLAAATGGRALRRASDIAGELDAIVSDGRAAYSLSFTPDTPADNTYHLLTVSLAHARNVTLRYRTGYLYSKEPVTMKERFQEAVWRPADIAEIGLTATAAVEEGPAALKLNIAGTDLALALQSGLWMDKLDIILIQRDDAALNAKLNGKTLAMRLKPATYEKILRDGIDVEVPMGKVPEGGALRVVVVDENSGRIGTLTMAASALAGKR